MWWPEGELTMSALRVQLRRGRVHYLALDDFTSHFNSINYCIVLTREPDVRRRTELGNKAKDNN